MELFCNVTRGSNIESYHHVNVVAIDESGKIIVSSGNHKLITCIRSSLKPFQASVVISEGAADSARFSEQEISLMCASHNGEKIHVNTARKMANKIGCSIHKYECGSHPPYDAVSRDRARKAGFTPFHNNCSGKHSGMLALAKYLHVPLEGYINADHPVQKKISKKLKSLLGGREIQYGIDGCSLPTPFLSLIEIAQIFQKLGSNDHPELKRAYNAMAKHPYMVGGKERFDTDFNAALKSRGITKVGGEAVRGMVIQTEQYGLVGIAQKITDGNPRANEVAIMAVLGHLGLLLPDEKEKLQKYIKKPIYNHRKILIGNVEAELKV